MNHADIPACAECVRWLFDKNWKIVRSLGQPVPRGKSPTPCWKCPKGPKPFENESTPRTAAAIEYHSLCAADAGLTLPRDRRVIENNALIDRIRDRLLREQTQALGSLALLLAPGGK